LSCIEQIERVETMGKPTKKQSELDQARRQLTIERERSGELATRLECLKSKLAYNEERHRSEMLAVFETFIPDELSDVFNRLVNRGTE